MYVLITLQEQLAIPALILVSYNANIIKIVDCAFINCSTYYM